ncbi:MAG: GNAT family N-acetyltransferase, partial [Gammaproteobacteria bacterium]
MPHVSRRQLRRAAGWPSAVRSGEHKNAEVSVVVGEEWRGHGYGTALLAAGIR